MLLGRWLDVLIALMVVVSVTSGCGGPGDKGVKVTGSVTMGGQPQASAKVNFIPADPKQVGSMGTGTGSDGKFEIKLEPGKYKVVLSRKVDNSGNVPGDSEDPSKDYTQLEAGGLLRQTFPPQYSDPASTTLSVEIPAEGKDLPAFDVAS